MSAPIPEADLAGADYFGVPESTVAEWRKRYQWPHVRIGRRIYYTPEQLDEILRRQTTVTPKKPKKIAGQTARSAARAAP